MAKTIKTVIKLQIAAGKANPAPPVGPALGQHGLNIQDFCSKFNAATQDRMGDVVPAEITVYEDRTYDFILKTPPASTLILQKIGKDKGSGKNLVSKAGTITKAQIREVAEAKMSDLNANDIEAASRIIEGSARSMGVDVK